MSTQRLHADNLYSMALLRRSRLPFCELRDGEAARGESANGEQQAGEGGGWIWPHVLHMHEYMIYKLIIVVSFNVMPVHLP